jgi:hypothetical protein
MGAVNEDVCRVCGIPIKIMVNRGTGICSENCRKKAQRADAVLAAELPPGTVVSRGGWVAPPKNLGMTSQELGWWGW